MARIPDDKLQQILDLLVEVKADYNLLRSHVLNQCFGYPLLAEGTNSGTLKTTNAVTYRIAGINYTKAATDNIAITAAAVQATDTYCLYLVSINANGDVTTTKGTAVATDTAVLPACPADNAVLGYFKIALSSAATFTAGTTDLGAANVVDTYFHPGIALDSAGAATAVSQAFETSVLNLYKV